MWTAESVKAAVESQREFFMTNVTLDVDWRIAQLRKLKMAIISHEQELIDALAAALGRSPAEAYFCDIYKVTDGEKVRLAQDVVSSDLQLYEDGNLFAYTDYRYYGDQGSGELAIFNPAGEKKKVGDDVTQYVRVDKNKVLFISDDKLYLFDGKEKESLQNDVEQIWCKNYLKPTDTLIYGIGD